jgi:hypothetical protein
MDVLTKYPVKEPDEIGQRPEPTSREGQVHRTYRALSRVLCYESVSQQRDEVSRWEGASESTGQPGNAGAAWPRDLASISEVLSKAEAV